MDGLFFVLSKTAGMVARAETWLVLLLLLATLAALRGRAGRAACWSGLALTATLALGAFPLGTPLLASLEQQYPASPPLDRVDGIIVLGGAEDIRPFLRWGSVGLNEAGERMTAGVALARRFPQARLIFTGGSASVIHDNRSEAPSQIARALWLELGVPAGQILLEDRSRNTSENAAFTRDLVAPEEGQVWVLVTSAFHMPRSVETFTRAGWTGLVPWPVDFRSGTQTFRLEWRLDDHLSELNVAMKEYLGLVVYRLAGK